MIQELAKRLIRQAEELQAQDIYILPRGTGYELLMRVGDDRRLIDVCESDRMANLISHFKFVAGMNVGEKRRCQLGACDYDLDDTKVSLRLSAVGDYQGQESLVIRLLYHHQRQLRY
ncbi:late competence protein ComGA [Streptococcus equi subsp. equi]|nr:late competence protein ComGA [Streptococcus equi subsp. equi]